MGVCVRDRDTQTNTGAGVPQIIISPRIGEEALNVSPIFKSLHT